MNLKKENIAKGKKKMGDELMMPQVTCTFDEILI